MVLGFMDLSEAFGGFLGSSKFGVESLGFRGGVWGWTKLPSRVVS